MLKDTGKAVTLGETTGGGSGNPKSLDLNFSGQEYKLSVSTWKLIRNSGKKLENIGIEPDIPVTITPDDVFDQRDRALEAALEYACG
jgi:C-terminal processing protease CtpA/Prc